MRFITSFMLILIHVYCMMMCIVNHLSNIIITMESFGQYFDSAFFDSYSSCLDINGCIDPHQYFKTIEEDEEDEKRLAQLNASLLQMQLHSIVKSVYNQKVRNETGNESDPLRNVSLNTLMMTGMHVF